MKTRYVLVGTGGRSIMFREALTGTYADRHELVGLCDVNEGRARLAADAARAAGVEVPVYAAPDFDRMIAGTKPHTVIVTTRDATHDRYICRAMELGCDVISEKPLTTDDAKCRRILETQRRTGRRCTVTFNYRYAPPATQIKDVLMSGAIGRVLSVSFQWLLDTTHGADYYRRWHRNKANSGSLLVHKATHHFDLLNWWLSDVPEEVFASGSRRFYTPETAARYGLQSRGRRCLDCPVAAKCPFYLDIRGFDLLRTLYLDCEQYDGYWRDKCIFDPESPQGFDPRVDIEDSMSATIRYSGGAVASYLLLSYASWEGYIVNFNGTRGRLQHRKREQSYVNADGSTPGEAIESGTSIVVWPLREEPASLDVWTGEGGHGGGDTVMLDYLFAPERRGEDRYRRAADQRAGSYSILCGVAANRSILEGRPVRLAELVPDIGLPDFPPMPE